MKVRRSPLPWSSRIFRRHERTVVTVTHTLNLWLNIKCVFPSQDYVNNSNYIRVIQARRHIAEISITLCNTSSSFRERNREPLRKCWEDFVFASCNSCYSGCYCKKNCEIRWSIILGTLRGAISQISCVLTKLRDKLHGPLPCKTMFHCAYLVDWRFSAIWVCWRWGSAKE